MSFSPKPGCPLCGVVSAARDSPSHNILHRDDNFTAYHETANPVSSKGHIIIAFNLHVPSIYMLSSSDLPLLVQVRDLATRLLTDLAGRPSTDVPASPISPSPRASTFMAATPTTDTPNFRIGFITPPWKDSKIPVTDHLHAHAYVLPADKLGWWRGVAYGGLAWYAIEDLIAEIREETTNNRVKSGYGNRSNAPIDTVADAGSRMGHADGTETTEPSLAIPDIEAGSRPPSRSFASSSSPSSSRPSSSRQLTVDTAAAAPASSSNNLEPAFNIRTIPV
ncbi:uncharacterized protein STEHIDRAFT_89903 [Stereum hirsutum FP-91666 SS1]|uniref:uncharacterized protein n=1 Tax=Stereum hirsutum (strain FP-91666) TaxID=721885 RepID=UPI000440E81E|nr:uncharacterized protein STEHIDRAFT_89903 [Stereum hirsutum FP-91666 SS1]EIM92689.1 hypothetical protein STEHIDRAFT_89903 [Stereum hirsutum FP-91666 SS1]